MKPCGPYRACDNCPPSPASLKVFVAQGTCNSDTPDPPVWLVVSVISDNRAGLEQPTYQLDYEVGPASERSYFVRNCKRIPLRLAAFLHCHMPQEDGLAGSRCSALGVTWALGHLFRPDSCPTRTPSA